MMRTFDLFSRNKDLIFDLFLFISSGKAKNRSDGWEKRKRYFKFVSKSEAEKRKDKKTEIMFLEAIIDI